MRIFALICIFLIMILSSCDSDFFDIKPRYNPERAGASIVESHTISGQLNTSLQDELYYSDLAILNDKIYIHTDGVINVFQKNPFKKIEEIEVTFLYTPDDSYKFDNDEFVVVNEEKGFLLCKFRITDDIAYLLFSLNLKTGKAEFMDMDKADIQTEKIFTRMGYDRINDYIWFSFSDFAYEEVSFYTYNDLNNEFVFQKKKKHLQYVINTLIGIFITGDEWFYTGFNEVAPRPHPINFGIVKYDVNIKDPNEWIYSIQTEYLGIKGSPSNILYDEPYIWIMGRKDGILQMLKLLPNE